MDLGLRGRVAIVAAASRGLGRAVAEELAREGAEIAICSRTAADLEKAASRIHSAGGREVLWQPVDVGDAAAVRRFVETVEENSGGWISALRIRADRLPNCLRPRQARTGGRGPSSC